MDLDTMTPPLSPTPATTSLFHLAFNYLMANEGGYSNHPADRGGATNYGITAAEALRHGITDVRTMTLTDAMDIYFRDYWQVWIPLSALSPRIAIKCFDCGVLMGNTVAMRLLQQTVDVSGYDPGPIDGLWGARTEHAITLALTDVDEDTFMGQYANEMSHRFQAIVDRNPSQSVFLKGWLNRAKKTPSAPLTPEEDS